MRPPSSTSRARQSAIAIRFAVLLAATAVLPLLVYGFVSILSLQRGTRDSVVSGNLNVDWLNWRFHVRPDKRAGMIVSLVQFNDGAIWRDMAYQMNVSEMFVPYMDADYGWYSRTYFDMGE
mgnify:CR=1 FL=1